ncbi:MAG: NAD(P)H-hydrate dehydratase [Planctomycetia bacterium]|nr:NAD(P)H-hydrate dehydratase [Planctomycetia bacterium]
MLRSVSSLPRLPVRPKDGHKGTFGKVLIVAGSVGMSGAAVLAGMGALRSGAGLVQVACPQSVQLVVAAGNPCYLTASLPCAEDGSLAEGAGQNLSTLAASASVVAFGPGLGTTPAIAIVLQALLASYEGPIIIDADGLIAMTELRLQGKLPDRHIPLICTPHPGELARMMGTTAQVVQTDRKQHAIRYLGDHKCILVLKGKGTIVTDGQRVYVNTTGNAGMAKGGSGDVLTGMIASLIAQGMNTFDAAQVGVHLHGLAGDLAASTLGEQAMLPTDLVDALTVAFKKYVPTI